MDQRLSQGASTVALGLAGDPSFRAPMGVAVVGGLFASTILSLFIVPATFTVFDDVQLWLSRKFGGKNVVPPAAAVPSPSSAS